MSFGSEIKKVRLSCFLNQKEFGQAIGVSFTTVNRWENEKAQPNIKAMKALKQFCTDHNCPYDPLEQSWQETKLEETP